MDQLMQSNSGDYLIQKQFEIMLDINNKKFTAEIQNLKQTITTLNQEIVQIKKQLQQSRYAEKRQSLPETKAEIQDTNKEPLRPRYGDFKPGDISVNKFFYCGKK